MRLGSRQILSKLRRQAIIWTNAGILLIGPIGINFSGILFEIITFSVKKMCLKVSFAKWRPFCLCVNVLSGLHMTLLIHDDIMTWNHFLLNWTFVREIHQSPVLSHHQRPILLSFDVILNKLLNKQSGGKCCLKVCLHGTRQAARLARDMLQRDLLRGNSVYMVGSCRARLLHIIHVSAFFGVDVLQRKLRQLLVTACAARQL